MATVGELIRQFELKLDKTDSGSYPDFDGGEIRFWLDEGAKRFIKKRYDNYERSQKRIDDLRISTVNENTLVFSENSDLEIIGGLDKSFKVFESDFPDDYWFLLNISLRINYTDCHSVSSETSALPKYIKQDMINGILKDPFNQPEADRPVYTVRGDKITVYLPNDGSSVSGAIIAYIKRPRLLLTDPFYTDPLTPYEELPDHAQDEMVNEAVWNVLENIESPRLQSNTAVLQTEE